jgi:hypothetical protein
MIAASNHRRGDRRALSSYAKTGRGSGVGSPMEPNLTRPLLAG